MNHFELSSDGLLQLMQSRRSVRSFDGQALGETHLQALSQFMQRVENPFGIPVRFKCLRGAQAQLPCPVVSGCEVYVGGAVQRCEGFELAYGYSFERLVLFAQSLGIGTVWIGGTFTRDAFQQQMQLAEGELMPCATPLGYAAEKMSLKETLMRKAISADTRLDEKQLFFEGSFSTPLDMAAAGDLAAVLQAVRCAPSAVNRQPWRLLVCGDTVHFYRTGKAHVSQAAGDMQLIDMGIALCHFMMAAEAAGMQPQLLCQAQPPEADGLRYVISCRICK